MRGLSRRFATEPRPRDSGVHAVHAVQRALGPHGGRSREARESGLCRARVTATELARPARRDGLAVRIAFPSWVSCGDPRVYTFMSAATASNSRTARLLDHGASSERVSR